MVKPTPVNPPALGRPLGFSHAMRTGGVLFLAGQIGADPLPDGRHRVVGPGLVEQFEKALRNVLAVVAEAGGDATSIAEMTVYVTSMESYRAARKEIGEAWKRVFGRHYPAMTLVEVASLFEEAALVEIRAVAAVA